MRGEPGRISPLMMDSKARATIEPCQRPDETIQTAGSPLGRRVISVRNVLSILLTLAVLYLVYRELLDLEWQQVWMSAQGTSVGLFALAFLVFYGTFFLRALRWKALLTNVGDAEGRGPEMPSLWALNRIMYLAWFANCVTVARLGDVYRGCLLKREAGFSFALTLGTVLIERLLDLLVLALMLGAGLLVVFHGSLPADALQGLAVALALSSLGGVGLVVLRRFGWAFRKSLPRRLHATYGRLERGLVGSFRRLPLLVAYTVAGWLLEGAALYAVTAAVGSPISVASALVVALAASLLTAIPLTPAGVGFTEAGTMMVLGWVGLDPATATAVTLLFRLISYWSIIVLGFLLYVFLRQRNQLTNKGVRSYG